MIFRNTLFIFKNKIPVIFFQVYSIIIISLITIFIALWRFRLSNYLLYKSFYCLYNLDKIFIIVFFVIFLDNLIYSAFVIRSFL